MQIKPIQQPTFNGYKSLLKKLWKRDKLKGVVKGLYGDVLTKDNLSVEHLKPHSLGGKTTLSNTAIASKAKNNARGNKPLKDFLTMSMVEAYLAPFEKIKIRGFDGHKYAQMIRKTAKELLK